MLDAIQESVELDTIEKRLRRVLQELNKSEAEDLLEILSSLEVEIVKQPATGLVMIRTTDCFGTLFNFGEVLVTQTEVKFKGFAGHATIMGDKAPLSLVAAIMSALVRSDNAPSDIMEKFDNRLTKYESRINNLREQEERLVAATRVNFESMAEER